MQSLTVNQQEVIKQALNALRVLTLAPSTAKAREVDPKAFEQADRSVAALEELLGVSND